MAISKKDVQHISKLASIDLTPAEEEKNEKDLSAVLNFVTKLNEVNTENVAPLTGGTDLINCMRKDEIIENAFNHEEKLSKVAQLVKAAPEHKEGFVKVKSVFN